MEKQNTSNNSRPETKEMGAKRAKTFIGYERPSMKTSRQNTFTTQFGKKQNTKAIKPV